MGLEYKIKFKIPDDFDSSTVCAKLPATVSAGSTWEIYGYQIDKDGIYFIDHLVDRKVAAVALRCFIDEALKFPPHVVEIVEA